MLELREDKKNLSYETEYNLYRKPIQIDMLVIKKLPDMVIENEIGKLFLGHNILEYKSPEDALNVDVYYKALAYAFLYKSQGDGVDTIKADDLTISLIRESKPKKLMHWFEENGYVVEPAYPGIYYVRKEGFPKTQVIVSKELGKKEHQWLRALTGYLEESEARSLVTSMEALQDEDDKRNADAVLDLVMTENDKVFDVLKKEESNVCEALLRLMKPELEEAKAKAEAEGRAEGRAEKTKIVALEMQKDGFSFEQIAKYLQEPVSKIKALCL